MSFDINEYLQALRAGELDKLLNLPALALRAHYTTEAASSNGMDELLPLLIYCFEKSDLSEEDFVYLQVIDAVMTQDKYFALDIVGVTLGSVLSGMLSALCMKKGGVSFPELELESFSKTFKEAQKVLDGGAISKHMGAYYAALSEEVETASFKDKVQKMMAAKLFYQKEQEACLALKACLKPFLDHMEVNKEKQSEQSIALINAFYQDILPITFLTADFVEKADILCEALRTDEPGADDTESNYFPDTVYSPFSIETMRKKMGQVLESFPRYQDEAKGCQNLKTQLLDYDEYFKRKRRKDKGLMTRHDLVMSLYQCIEPHRFISVDMSEQVQAFTIALKLKLQAIPQSSERKKEEGLLQILYDADFLKLITPYHLPIVSDVAEDERSKVQTPFTPKRRKKDKKEKTVELDTVHSFREGREQLYGNRVHAMRSTFWKHDGEVKEEVPNTVSDIIQETDLPFLLMHQRF